MNAARPPEGAPVGAAAAAYDALAAQVHGARDASQLAFLACNATRSLVPYRQAALVEIPEAAGRVRLAGHSGLADVDRNAPYALWLADVVQHLRPQLDALPAQARVLPVSPAMLPEHLAEHWADWLPAHVWLLPLPDPEGHTLAVLLLARDTPWPTEIALRSQEHLLLQAAALYGYAWWALTRRRPRLGGFWRRVPRARALRWGAVAVAALLVVPVREYSLVPAEVVSTRSQVIASPRDGVVRRMVVAPNTPVKAGQPIAELDDTTLYNRRAVAQAALSTAQTEQLQTTQRAIENQNAKAEMHLAEGRLRERVIEEASLARELEQLVIRAPADGVFIYSDPDDWAGRPVQTGERVGLLADPQALGVHLWAPVNEPVNLASGAPVTLFLSVSPLDPVAATLDYAGYQVVESPGGVASYLLRGTLAGQAPLARIGLRGTGRITGGWTPLGYLMLRRPLAALREWGGW